MINDEFGKIDKGFSIFDDNEKNKQLYIPEQPKSG